MVYWPRRMGGNMTITPDGKIGRCPPGQYAVLDGTSNTRCDLYSNSGYLRKTISAQHNDGPNEYEPVKWIGDYVYTRRSSTVYRTHIEDGQAATFAAGAVPITFEISERHNRLFAVTASTVRLFNLTTGDLIRSVSLSGVTSSMIIRDIIFYPQIDGEDVRIYKISIEDFEDEQSADLITTLQLKTDIWGIPDNPEFCNLFRNVPPMRYHSFFVSIRSSVEQSWAQVKFDGSVVYQGWNQHYIDEHDCPGFLLPWPRFGVSPTSFGMAMRVRYDDIFRLGFQRLDKLCPDYPAEYDFTITANIYDKQGDLSLLLADINNKNVKIVDEQGNETASYSLEIYPNGIAPREVVYADGVSIINCSPLPPFVTPGPPWTYYAKCEISLVAEREFPGAAVLIVEYRNRIDGGDWSAVLSTHADADGVAVLTSGWINRYALAEPQFIEFMVEDVVWEGVEYVDRGNVCDGCEQTITDEDMV